RRAPRRSRPIGHNRRRGGHGVKPIRVLFFLTSPVRGGVEEVVLALLQRLDPDEFKVALAAPAELLDALGPDLDGVRVDTLAVHAESWWKRDELARLGAFM